MARKKSAAKKAKEEELRQQVLAEDDEPEEVKHQPKDARKGMEEEEEEEGEDEDSSSSEEEDEYGDLLTEDIDHGISQVLKTLREDPEKLKDPNVKFFDELPKEGELYQKSKETSMSLKDYHRMRLLQDGNKDEEEDEGGDDGEKPYAVQQEIDKTNLVSEIHTMADNEGDGDGDGDDFMVKKEQQPEIEGVDLPAAENEQEFLKAFLDNKAWLPTKPSASKRKLDDDDDEFDNMADKYEHAYNFRFEEEDAGEIVSYARNQNTIRRKEESSRKRARDRKKEAREQEQQEYDQKVNKVKKQKTKQVMDKLTKLRQELGDEIGGMFTEKDFEGEFDDTEWDKRMQQVFNDEFYAQKDSKPEFGSDDEERQVAEEGDKEQEQEQEQEPQLSKTQQAKQQKQKQKQERQEIRQKAEEFVDKNLDLALQEAHVEKPSAVTRFKYREVSPDSFGLDARDILLASDKQLNSYVGLKKLGEFRDPDQKKKERRKYAKQKRLRDWRKDVFHREDGPTDEQMNQAFQQSKK